MNDLYIDFVFRANCNSVLWVVSASYVVFFHAPILFRPKCVVVERCINGFWHYFSYGEYVKWESSVKFVVPFTNPCVAACFLPNETVTPPRRQFQSLDRFDRRFEFPALLEIWILNLNFKLGFSRLLSNPLIKLAKNGLIWPVSHPRTMPIVYQMLTLFLIRGWLGWYVTKLNKTHPSDNFIQKFILY